MTFIFANCLTFLQYVIFFVVDCCDLNNWCEYYMRGGVSAISAIIPGFKKWDCNTEWEEGKDTGGYSCDIKKGTECKNCPKGSKECPVCQCEPGTKKPAPVSWIRENCQKSCGLCKTKGK